jgi:hypothetical protein
VRNSANSGPGELSATPGGRRRAMIGVVGVSRDTDMVKSGRMQSWIGCVVDGGVAASDLVDH